MKHAAYVLGFATVVVLLAWLVVEGADREREHACRDSAVLVFRHCGDSPEVCDRRAKHALDVCMEEQP